MKVMQTYSRRAIKLCHLPPGTVFLADYNDGRYDTNLYMVVFTPQSAANLQKYNAVNLASGELSHIHGSTRVVKFDDAYVTLTNED